MTEIILGDCLEVMKSFPDNHFTGIFTDPPYGLHFMGKDWDHGIPGTHFWREAIRIVKPGGQLISFGGTRTYHRLACAIEDAGWEIRDYLCWLFGSGFPKSYNHFGPDGFGTALKPAYEPIIMAMKPLDGTFKQNYEKWGVGGLNIDACRIATSEKITAGGIPKYDPENGWHREWMKDEDKCLNKTKNALEKANTLGRWPANLILDEEAAAILDEQSGVSKSTDKQRKQFRKSK